MNLQYNYSHCFIASMGTISICALALSIFGAAYFYSVSRNPEAAREKTIFYMIFGTIELAILVSITFAFKYYVNPSVT